MPACVYFSSSETFAYWAFGPSLVWVCSFVIFHSSALPVLWTSLSLHCLHVDLLRPSGQKRLLVPPSSWVVQHHPIPMNTEVCLEFSFWALSGKAPEAVYIEGT